MDIETGEDKKILRTTTAPVQSFDDALANRADDMLAAMVAANGVGLAAPQVGKDMRFFVVDANAMPDDLRDVAGFGDEGVAVANPLLLETNHEQQEMTEGCLSLPDRAVRVPRATAITLQGQNLAGDRFTVTVKGYAARILQHETDHLDGTLIIDKGEEITDPQQHHDR